MCMRCCDSVDERERERERGKDGESGTELFGLEKEHNFCSLEVFWVLTVNTDEAICKLCNKKMTARDGNTLNLRAHIRNHHPLTAAWMKNRAHPRTML